MHQLRTLSCGRRFVRRDRIRAERDYQVQVTDRRGAVAHVVEMNSSDGTPLKHLLRSGKAGPECCCLAPEQSRPQVVGRGWRRSLR